METPTDDQGTEKTNDAGNRNLLDEVQSRLDATPDESIEYPKAGHEKGYVLDRSKNVDTWDGDNSATQV